MQIHPIFLVFFASFIFIWSARGCLGPQASTRSTGPAYMNEISISSEAAADGLDLKALNAVVKKAKDARDLEHYLNQPQSINNLDLNNDGEVDYIFVTEYGNKADAYGFSLTVQPEKDEVQEIATIEIIQDGERAQVQYRGNSQIYGPNYQYSAFHGVGTFLLWSYLLSPHPFYASPWGYGYYPNSYSGYRTVPNTVYQNRNAGRYGDVKRVARNDSLKSGKGLTSPNKNKTAGKGIRKSLRNPTATQKAFQTRSRTSRLGSGGFGRSSTRSGNIRSYSSSRGFGGFGK